MALGTDDWLTLALAKTHLNLDAGDTSDDAELEDFIRRTEGALFTKIGHVKQPAVALVEHRLVEARPGGGKKTLRLTRRPVFNVTEISVGGEVLAAANLDTGADGWYLNPDVALAGIVHHTSGFPSGFLKVSYKPGRNPIPPDLSLAGYELLRHLWKTQRGTISRPGLMGDEPLDPAATRDQGAAPHAAGYMLPNRVAELLRDYMLIPAA